MADGADEAGLIVLPRTKALDVFTTPIDGNAHAAIDPILAKVRATIDAFEPDLSTASSRKAIASMAYKVSQSKAHLQRIAKELTAEQKKIPNLIDASRRYVEAKLDAWRDEVRQPLTDWETAEDDRVAAIKSSLAELQAVIDDRQDRPSETIRDRLAEVKREAITEQFYAEYIGAAAELKDKAIAVLEAALDAAEKREAEAAELDRLRKEAAERARVEAEAKAKADAAERERKAAEAAVAAERAKAESAARAAQDEAERKERAHKAELEAVERRAVDAARRAKQEAEQAALKEAAEKAKREANKNHRAKINRAALAAFVEGGIAEDTAKQVITLIAAGSVPAVTINY